MTPAEHDQPEHDFPTGLARPALRALHGAGYTKLDQLASVTEADLSKLHGMGPKAIGQLREALQARGLAFASRQSSYEIRMITAGLAHHGSPLPSQRPGTRLRVAVGGEGALRARGWVYPDSVSVVSRQPAANGQ